MQAEPAGGFRGFLRSTPGRVAWILLTVGIVFATFAYVSTLLAIPVMLVVGLALPIYAGLKRPRFLALGGLVVLIAVAPIATVVFTQELLTPPGPGSSSSSFPDGSGGAVLTDATLSPFVGSTSTTFTWNVTIYPKFLSSLDNGTNWSKDSVQVYISTCPGATSANSTYCSGGFPLIILQDNLTAPPANGTVLTFQHRVGASGIWSWQMALVLANKTDPSNPTFIRLSGDPTYDAMEGPIIGGFATVYGALIGPIYLDEFIYVGIPFFFILLLYMWFKSREARRKQAIKRAAREMAAASGGTAAQPAGGAAAPGPGGPAGGAAPAGPGEATCPSCGAVVYPNETKCWKCGAGLSPLKEGGSPLSSGSGKPG